MFKTVSLVVGGLAACLLFLIAIITLNPEAAVEGSFLAINTALGAAEEDPKKREGERT